MGADRATGDHGLQRRRGMLERFRCRWHKTFDRSARRAGLAPVMMLLAACHAVAIAAQLSVALDLCGLK